MLTQRHRGGDHRRRPRGFTLIELMVVLAVVAVSVTLAAPSFSLLIANYRVRSGAESILNGINLARAEAVRRNSNVSFSLTANSTGWTVCCDSLGLAIQTRSGNDSPGVVAASSNATTSVTFQPTGLRVSTGTPMSQVSVTSTVSGTDSRRINIFGGGLIRMCDPGVSTANDPRRC